MLALGCLLDFVVIMKSLASIKAKGKKMKLYYFPGAPSPRKVAAYFGAGIQGSPVRFFAMLSVLA